MHIFAYIVGLVLVAILTVGQANSSEIYVLETEQKCKALYTGWWEILDRKRCISRLGKERAENFRLADEERRKQIEIDEAVQAARPCILEEIPSLEAKILEIRNQLEEEVKLAPVTILKSHGLNYKLKPSTKNYKEKVVILQFDTKCDTKLSREHRFHFTVNIKFNDEETITVFGVWAENPPPGLESGWQEELDINFPMLKAEREQAARQEFLKANDHCAPNLSRSERLRRLALRGTVRQDNQDHFSAEGSSVWFGHGERLSLCH